MIPRLRSVAARVIKVVLFMPPRSGIRPLIWLSVRIQTSVYQKTLDRYERDGLVVFKLLASPSRSWLQEQNLFSKESGPGHS